jgi:hypothetical protein
MSDVFRHWSGTGKSYCRTRSDVGSERVKVRHYSRYLGSKQHASCSKFGITAQWHCVVWTLDITLWLLTCILMQWQSIMCRFMVGISGLCSGSCRLKIPKWRIDVLQWFYIVYLSSLRKMLGMCIKTDGHIVSNSLFTDGPKIQCYITSTADETLLNVLSFKECIQQCTLYTNT